MKKPENRAILELIDEEYSYSEVRTSNCTASPVYRCPYRRYKTSTQRSENVEFLSEEIVSPGRAEAQDALELVDPDGMCLESRLSECVAPSSYRCVHRHYNQSPPTAHVGMLHEIGSSCSDSSRLRLVLKLGEPDSSK